MKKHRAHILLFFFLLALTACDLIDDDHKIDDQPVITSSYCEDHEDDVLCVEKDMEHIEVSSVSSLFNAVIDVYDTNDEDFCANYIALTNRDLFNKCESHAIDLYPSNFLEYSFLEVHKDELTANTYHIVYINLVDHSVIEFRLLIVNINDALYIKDWSYTTSDKLPDDLEVTLTDAKTFSETYIKKYLDKSLSSKDFCTLYDTDDNTEECILERESLIQEETTITIKDISKIGDYFELIILIDSYGSVGYDQTIYILLDYDDNGEIFPVIVSDEKPEDIK